MPERTGRPSIYSEELVDEICERIANGQSVRELCRDDAMPGMSTLFRWLAANESFRERYARAKEAQVEYLAEELLEIADDGSNDWMLRKNGEDATETVNHEHITRSKVRIDTRKWLLAKLAPKKYGDRLGVDHSGKIALTHEDALGELE